MKNLLLALILTVITASVIQAKQHTITVAEGDTVKIHTKAAK